MAAGILETSGDVGTVGFRSGVVEAAVRAGAGPIVARDLHRRLAAAVAPAGAEDGPGVVERARHLLAAGAADDVTARTCLAGCLYEERRGSARVAEELARNGLDLAGAADGTRVGLLRALARLLFASGHTRRAIEAAHEAVVVAQRGDRQALLDAVGDLAWVDPRVVDVEPGRRALYEDALADPACPPASRAVLLGRLAFATMVSDPAAARALAGEAVAVAQECGSERATAAARAAWFFGAYRLDTAAEVEAEGRRLFRRGDDRAAAGALFPTALGTGDRALVDVMVDQAVRDPDRQGLVTSRRMLDAVRLGLALSDGDAEGVLRHACEIAEHGTTDLQSLAMPLVMLWFGHTGLDVDLPHPFAVTAPPSSDLGRYAALTMATVSVLNDRSVDRSTVLALFEPRELLLGRRDGPFADLVPALAAIVGNVLGDAGLCLSALEHLERHQDRFLLLFGVVPLAPVGWLVAGAQAGLGDRRAALRSNERAGTLSRNARFDLWTAQCLLQRAELLEHSGPTGAAAAARSTLELAEAKGWPLMAHRARRLLAHSSTGSRPALSRAQEETLRLVAAGLTNDSIARRLGVSVSTVEKHLSQVYRRLNLPNRAAAARWYTDSDAGSGGRQDHHAPAGWSSGLP